MTTTASKLLLVVQGKDETKGLFGSLSGSLRTLGKVGGIATAAIGAAVGVMGKKALDAGMEFDSAMRNVNAIAQLPEAQFKKLSEQVVAFSTTTRASASDVASSLYNVVSAGFSAEEGFKVMEQASRAAGAGLASTTDTSKLLISAMRAYAIPVDQASRVTDIFLQTVNEGLTTLPELSSSMGRILPIASNLGVGLEEVSYSLAQMTQSGLSTDEATTRLMAMLTGMLSPGKELTAVIERLGYASGVDFVQQSGGALGALSKLKDEGFLGTTEQAAALFHNVRGLGGVLALLTNDANTAGGAVEAFGERAGGAVERARTEQYKSLSAVLAKIKGAFEGIVLSITQQFIPTFASIGEKILPFIQRIAGEIAPIAEGLGAMFNEIIAIAGAFISRISETLGLGFGKMSGESGAWGRNVVVSFAKGMASAIAAVVAVLNRLAQVITGFLRPGSPPKLLPNLDEWGAGAMTAYMDGWGEGDFGVFNELSGVLEEHVKSMSEDVVPKDGLVPMIVGARSKVAEAIDSIRQMGADGSQAVSIIQGAIGEMSPALSNYVQSMFDVEASTRAVAAAQDELNETTRKYDDMLAPLNSQLQEIQDQKNAIRDQERLAKLQKTLTSWKATDAEKEMARLEIQEMELKKQVTAVGKEKDAAVKASQAKLTEAQKQDKAAKRQYALAKQMAGITKKQNSLFDEQSKMLEGVVGAVEKLSEKAGEMDLADSILAMGGGAGGALGDMVPDDITGELEGMLSGLSEGVAGSVTEGLTEGMDVLSIADEISAAFAPVGEGFDALSLSTTNLWDVVTGFFDDVSEKMAPVLEWVGQFITWKDALILLAGAIGITLMPIILGIIGTVGLFALKIAAITAVIGVVRTAWENDWGGIRTKLTEVWENTIKPALGDLWEWLKVKVPEALETLSQFWEETLWPALESVWAWITDTLFPMFQDLWDWLNTVIPPVLEALAIIWEEVLLPAIKAAWDFIQTSLVPLFLEISGLIGDLADIYLTALTNVWKNDVLPVLNDVWDFLVKSFTPAIEIVSGWVETWAEKLEDLKLVVKGVTDFIAGLRDQLTNIQLPDWMTPGSPTPWEIGLRGVGSAMSELNVRHLPAFSDNLNRVNDVKTQNNYFTQNINSSAPTQGAIGEFQLMQSLVGGI